MGVEVSGKDGVASPSPPLQLLGALEEAEGLGGGTCFPTIGQEGQQMAFQKNPPGGAAAPA